MAMPSTSWLTLWKHGSTEMPWYDTYSIDTLKIHEHVHRDLNSFTKQGYIIKRPKSLLYIYSYKVPIQGSYDLFMA